MGDCKKNDVNIIQAINIAYYNLTSCNNPNELLNQKSEILHVFKHKNIRLLLWVKYDIFLFSADFVLPGGILLNKM